MQGGWPLALARRDSCSARRQKMLSLPIGARRPPGGGMWVGHGWVGVEELSSRPSPNDAVATVGTPTTSMQPVGFPRGRR
jgi:hypothetical protein